MARRKKPLWHFIHEQPMVEDRLFEIESRTPKGCVCWRDLRRAYRTMYDAKDAWYGRKREQAKAVRLLEEVKEHADAAERCLTRFPGRGRRQRR